MKGIEIRKMNDEDIPRIVDIWYETSVTAHSFISEKYWESNRELMKTQYLPISETYVALINNDIAGFISIIDEYLAAIFVRPDTQGKGIGSSLLNHVKSIRNNLQLKVYMKNQKTIEFYKAHGFAVVSESTDNETDENEFIMEWHK